MFFFKSVQVKLNERVVLFRNSLPFVALGPGRYSYSARNLTEQRFKISDLVFEAMPEVLALLDASWFSSLTVQAHERAVLFRSGRPAQFLQPGEYTYWTIDPSVRVEVFDTREKLTELSDALFRLIPKDELVDVQIASHEQGLRSVAGELVGVLGAGVYREWSTKERPVSIEKIDMRRTELSIVGQELMTRDKVTLRLSLTAEYAIEDARLSREVTSVKDALYVLVQLAVREFVASVTLDALLEGRDALTQALREQVLPAAKSMGVRVERLGVKDVVLPGEMKTLLNRVIEAEKEAQANVILRREETAATRSLANTAKVMAQEPILLRLKELETMKEIAERIQEVRVVIGADGLGSLMPAQLLGASPQAGKVS